VLLDAWDRNNAILLGLFRALPAHGLDARVTTGSPAVSQLFTHLCFTRICAV
jgi:hypothetical protein